MSAASPSQANLSSSAYEAAARRLGRTLTLAERSIDIVQFDRDLAAGKHRLYAAVEREKRRAVNAHFRYRKPVKLRVTPEMVAALRSLYRTGQRHARQEIHALTGRRLAERELSARDDLDRLVRQLEKLLRPFQSKVDDATAEQSTKLTIGEIAHTAAARQVLQMRGALDVASRMVSSAAYAGRADVYSEEAGLFTNGWQVTALMDAATCDPCAEGDGQQFASPDDAASVMDNGGFGPRIECDGNGRCRCTLVPL